MFWLSRIVIPDYLLLLHIFLKKYCILLYNKSITIKRRKKNNYNIYSSFYQVVAIFPLSLYFSFSFIILFPFLLTIFGPQIHKLSIQSFLLSTKRPYKVSSLSDKSLFFFWPKLSSCSFYFIIKYSTVDILLPSLCIYCNNLAQLAYTLLISHISFLVHRKELCSSFSS